ncbi:unnamed protein product [Closterium sp. Naga37s-1]|nr:unnamed protein product [Closterium sp. Naga37s-1]
MPNRCDVSAGGAKASEIQELAPRRPCVAAAATARVAADAAAETSGLEARTPLLMIAAFRRLLDRRFVTAAANRIPEGGAGKGMRTDGKDGKDGKDGEHSRTHSMKKKMGSVLGWAARILPQSTSGGKGLGAERRSESEVERRVVEALRRRREEEEASGKKRIVHFNTLVMKFAKSDEAFKQIRKQFDQYGARTIPQDKHASQAIDLEELTACSRLPLPHQPPLPRHPLPPPPFPPSPSPSLPTDKDASQSIDLEELSTYKDASQSIDLEELRTCLSALGVRIEEEEVMQLYREADMDCCDGMHFKEFILLLALLYLLQPNAHFGLPEVEEAFGLIADAFNFFDTTGEGFLTQAKVQAAMSSGRDSSPSRIAGQRFAEMDYNTDGQCTFKEFLFAYVGWVGTAEEEEDEEEEEEKEEERSKTPKTPKTPKSPSKSPKSPKSPRTPRHSGGHR